MNPNLVNSPKKHISNVKVIFINQSKTFAIASLDYDGIKRIGIRWNGEEGEKGYPQAYGYPTWFLLPKAVALAYADKLGNAELMFSVQQSSDEE